jgi:hypothetical protein
MYYKVDNLEIVKNIKRNKLIALVGDGKKMVDFSLSDWLGESWRVLNNEKLAPNMLIELLGNVKHKVDFQVFDYKTVKIFH